MTEASSSRPELSPGCPAVFRLQEGFHRYGPVLFPHGDRAALRRQEYGNAGGIQPGKHLFVGVSACGRAASRNACEVEVSEP